MISQKPLHAAPPRLQRMLLKIQGYNYCFVYRPGTEMVLADTLSRLPNAHNRSEVELDVRVDGIDASYSKQSISLINFSADKQKQLRDETTSDPVLNQLKEVIHTGWPETIKELPTDLRSFWSYRDELAVEAGVIFKGRQVLIPLSMRQDILNRLHQGHQGVEKTRQFARDTVYWPHINADIERVCKSCDACQEHQPTNCREPLMPHRVPSRPWQCLASDTLDVQGKQYLLIIDRYTKYPLLDEMKAPVTSYAVAEKVKHYCSLFGRPDEFMSHNGPQYTGQAFKNFTDSWQIKHITSSPEYPRSNGLAERHVRHLKPLVKKCLQQGDDVQLAL